MTEQKKTNGEVLTLFPSPIFLTNYAERFKDLGDLDDLIENLIKYIEEQDVVESSVIHCRKSNQLHKIPELKELCEGIISLGESICEFYHLDYDELYITSMWANLSTSEYYSQRQHIHPNNYLSGIIHLKGPENCSGTTFCDPRPAVEVFEPEYTQSTMFNTTRQVIPFVPGNVLIFPSWLPHCVLPSEMPFKNDDVRITLSFNLMFREKTD